MNAVVDDRAAAPGDKATAPAGGAAASAADEAQRPQRLPRKQLIED